jgi:N4-gp56 family major capsid protein
MATVTTSNPSDFASRVQAFYNPKLLSAIKDNLALAQYGLQGKYPAGGSTPTVRFFRPRAANTTGVAAIAEGTTPTTLTEVAVGYVDVTLAQRGALAKITDLVLATDLLDTVKLYTQTMGADAALDLDTVCRDALVAKLNDSDTTYTGYWERFAGVANTGDSSVDYASLYALSAAESELNRVENMKALTQLRAGKVPMINGKFIAITPPQVIHDLRQDTTLTGAFQNSDVQALYKHAQLTLDGTVFVEATNPFRETNYKTHASTGKVFSTIYLGAAAFGVPGLDNSKAGGSPFSPQLVLINKPDHANPLGLYVQLGWKAMYGAAALVTNVTGEVPHYVILRSQSTFA